MKTLRKTIKWETFFGTAAGRFSTVWDSYFQSMAYFYPFESSSCYLNSGFGGKLNDNFPRGTDASTQIITPLLPKAINFRLFFTLAEKFEESKRVKELETSVINTTQIWETTITSYHLMEPPLGKAKRFSF